MLTEVLGEIVLPKLMSQMINIGVIGGEGVPYISGRAGIMLGSILLMIIGGVGGHYLSIRASVYFTGDLRNDLFKKIQSFSFKNICAIVILALCDFFGATLYLFLKSA